MSLLSERIIKALSDKNYKEQDKAVLELMQGIEMYADMALNDQQKAGAAEDSDPDKKELAKIATARKETIAQINKRLRDLKGRL